MKEFVFYVAAMVTAATLTIAIVDRFVVGDRYRAPDTAAVLAAERTAERALAAATSAKQGIGDAALVCLALILGVVVVCVTAITRRPMVDRVHTATQQAVVTQADAGLISCADYYPDVYQGR